MAGNDTPPSSPLQSGIEIEELDDNDMIEADEVLYEVRDIDGESIDTEMNNGMDEIVELPEREDATFIFQHHTASIFCGSLSNDAKLAVTGGEDDKAYVWDVVTGNVILECTGHQDSVIFAAFNYGGTYLATGDMNGVVRIWQMSDRKAIKDFKMGDATWMQWHTKENVIFAGSVNGDVHMWRIPDGDCNIVYGYGERAETAVLMPDGKRLAVGYGDGLIRLLDLKTYSTVATVNNAVQNCGHHKTITSIDCCSDDVLIISSSVDGRTIVSNSQNGRVISVLQDLSQNSGMQTETSQGGEDSTGNWVESVAFNKGATPKIAASGSLNGEILLWDVARVVVRHKIQLECGITKLVWKENSSLLFAACFDGVLRCFDGRSGECVRSYLGHTANILDLCLSKDGKTVLTTSDDSTARIFEIDAH